MFSINQLISGTDISIVEAYELISTINSVRLNASEYHDEWYKVAADLACSIDVKPMVPHNFQIHLHRDNTPADTRANILGALLPYQSLISF